MGDSYFYSPSTKGFYPEHFLEDYRKPNTLPEDLIKVSEGEYRTLTEDLGVGKIINVVGGELVSSENPKTKEHILTSLKDKEITWRDGELNKSDIELNKVLDKDPKSVGTESMWRSYRLDLRAWPEHRKFPSKKHRPTAPTND